MPRYKLAYNGAEEAFTAKDAEHARRRAADRLGREMMIPEGTVTGPNGQTWGLSHDGRTDGRNGWTSGGKNVFPKQTPRPGTLWNDNWRGIYELNDGRFLMADESTDFFEEDFALVGAVYYAIYDESGRVDGGWFGFDEDGTWNDFVDFVYMNHHVNVGRRIYPGNGDEFGYITMMLDAGTPADEIYGLCGVSASKSLRSKSKAGKSKASASSQRRPAKPSKSMKTRKPSKASGTKSRASTARASPSRKGNARSTTGGRR